MWPLTTRYPDPLGMRAEKALSLRMLAWWAWCQEGSVSRLLSGTFLVSRAYYIILKLPPKKNVYIYIYIYIYTFSPGVTQQSTYGLGADQAFFCA